MLRGEHDKSDRRSSSALDRGMPIRAAHLPLVVASMPMFSHVRFSSLCGLLAQGEQLIERALKTYGEHA